MFEKLFEKTIDKDGKMMFVPRWEYIGSIPEFAKLKECEQNPHWHSEGNAWIHTQNVVEWAIEYNRPYFSEFNDRSRIILLSALFHDIGKGITTFRGKDEKWHSYNHEIEGEKITRRLLWDEGFEIREAVCALVRYHMEPLKIMEGKHPMEAILSLSKQLWECNVDICTLLALKRFDLEGSLYEDTEMKKKDAEKLKELIALIEAMHLNNPPYHFGYNMLEKWKRCDDDKQKITVYMMIGLPGSGKDSFLADFRGIKAQSGVVIPNDAIIACRDEIRAKLGYCEEGDKIVATPEQEERVSEEFWKIVSDAARDGKDIIINNINLKRKYRTEVRTKLLKYNVNMVYIYIESANLKENIWRRRGYITEEDFKGMIGRFEWPTYDEYNTFIRIKNI